MNLLILISCVFISLAAAFPWIEIKESNKLSFKPHHSLELDEAWSAFKDTHGKQYESNDDEIKRKDIFGENLKKIQIHNYLYSKGLKSYTLGINQFADMTVDEFKNKMNGYKMVRNRTEGVTYLSPNLNVEVPDSIDWRTKGYVTPIKNQGQCGSCWAFSTTGALEGQHYRATGKLVSLSEQNLVDCSGKYGNDGCNGGLMDNAFKYVKENGGIDTEKSYPYVGKDMKCHFKKSEVGATDKGFVDVTPGSESKLKEAVATVGPVSIAIDANHASFQMYHSGVYDEPECTDELDHGVLIVGYGTKNGLDYWIVKNSWGTSWGDEGFIYMSRNKNNQCGVASAASYPLV